MNFNLDTNEDDRGALVSTGLENNDDKVDYKAIVENSCHGICIYDKDFIIKYVNPCSKKDLNLSENELLGKSILTLFDEIITNDLIESRNKLLSNNNINFEVSFEGQFNNLDLIFSSTLYYDNKFKENLIKTTFSNVTTVVAYQNQLIYSKNTLNGLYQNTSELIYFVDPKELRITWFNRGAYDFFKLVFGKVLLIGDKIEDLYTDKIELTSWKYLLKKAFNEGFISEEFYYEKINGYFQFSINRILANDEIIALSLIGKDVSESKIAQQELEITRERFQQAFQMNPSSISMIDLDDFKVIDVNGSFEENYGYKKEEVINRSLLELGIVERPILENISKLLLSGNNIKNQEIPLTKKNGLKFIAQFSAKLMQVFDKKYILTASIDISEKKRIENLLKISEEKFHKSFIKNPASISINDMNDGNRFVEVNDAFLKLHGLNRDQVVGKLPQELGVFYDSLEATEINDKIIKNELKDFEFRFIDKNNEVGYGLISSENIEINDREYSIVINVDISQQKLLESELRAAKEKAEESDRLKTAFLSNISHEIRTPLNAILGFAALYNDPNLSNDERNEFYNIIKKRSDDLLQVVTDILDISKIETNQFSVEEKEGNLSDTLNQVFELYEKKSYRENKGQIKFSLNNSIATEKCNIITDFARVSQVLKYLLDNAFKFTNEGHIEFGAKINNQNQLQFFVKDTGIGIPEQFLESIFQRFRQTEDSHARNYEGLGLGLSVSKGIVDLLKGKIWVESALNQGSTFNFIIPYKPVYKKEELKDSNLVQLNSKVVLIIEDDLSNLLYLDLLLKTMGMKTITAKNGLMAIELFKNNENIDIILLDLKLPDIQGYDLTKMLKKTRKNIPILAQSGYASEEDRIQSIEAGCDDFIGKPMTKFQLEEKLKRLLML